MDAVVVQAVVLRVVASTTGLKGGLRGVQIGSMAVLVTVTLRRVGSAVVPQVVRMTVVLSARVPDVRMGRVLKDAVVLVMVLRTTPTAAPPTGMSLTAVHGPVSVVHGETVLVETPGGPKVAVRAALQDLAAPTRLLAAAVVPTVALTGHHVATVARMHALTAMRSHVQAIRPAETTAALRHLLHPAVATRLGAEAPNGLPR